MTTITIPESKFELTDRADLIADASKLGLQGEQWPKLIETTCIGSHAENFVHVADSYVGGTLSLACFQSKNGRALIIRNA